MPRHQIVTAPGCVGRDHAVAFDFLTGKFLGVIAELRRLNGQALLLLLLLLPA
jgi:hypothetical protein